MVQDQRNAFQFDALLLLSPSLTIDKSRLHSTIDRLPGGAKQRALEKEDRESLLSAADSRAVRENFKLTFCLSYSQTADSSR
jgi:hypothetical protein